MLVDAVEVNPYRLYIEHSLAKSGGDGLVDLKKKHLDQFVNDYKNISEADGKKALRRSRNEPKSDVTDL